MTGKGAYVITAALVLAVVLAVLLPFGTHSEAWAPSQTAGTDSDYLQEGAVAGSPDKFDRDFYRTVLELAGHQVPGQTGLGDILYRDVVIVVNKYDVDGRNVSGENKDAVAGMLMSAGAQNVAVSETLSFVTASVPAGEILGISGHAAVYRIGDGESQTIPIIDAARVTIRATDDDLRRPDGVIANGSGVAVGVVDNGVNHPSGINDRVVDRVVCSSHTCQPNSAENVRGPDAANVLTTHGTHVALIIAGSGFSENNGIAQGVDILDAGNGQRGGGGHSIELYTGVSWLLRSGADVVNLSLASGTCNNNDTMDTNSLIVGDAVNNGLVVVVGAGNYGALGTGRQQVPVYKSVSELACSHNVITVGGIDNRDRGNTMMYESSRGPGSHQINGTSYPVLKPEIAAPAYYNLPIFTANGITGLVYGTSYATPAVTATAALVLQARDVEPTTVKAAILLGANWTGPVPCTSVQFEQDNATDNCSHERQPSSFEEANRDGSLEIINNVGFGILDTARTLDYVTLESGRHIVEANLGSDADTDAYMFEITDTADPVKVILSWTADPFFEDYYAPRGENYFADLGFTVDCPGMDTISAQSAYQSNEFAVFMPAQTGTCTVTVSGSGIDTPRRSEQKYALASTFPLIPPDILGTEPAISSDGQSPTNSQNVTFAVDFGKAVDPVTFDSSDILISSGNMSEPFTADNQIFTFTVSSPDDGTLAASIPARAVLYADDNTNPASGTASVEIDTVPPTVASIVRTDPSEWITSSETLTFGVTFDEPVTGVDPESFALSLDAIGYHGWFTHARDVQVPILDAGTIVYSTNTVADARQISGYYYSDGGKLTLTFDEAADPGLVSGYYSPTDERVVSDTITVTSPGRIASVSVDVDITHAYIGDLVVDLVAPDGTVMNLHNMTGFYANDIVRTYTPDFNGTAVAGDWRLRMSDNLVFDTGTLNGWTLTIVYSDALEAVTGINGTGAQYPVTVRAALNGTYNLDIVPDSGITDIAGNLLEDTDSTGEDQSYIVDTSFVLNTSSNNLPLTDAGYDLTVHEGQRVALSGTAVDVEGDPMTYLWSHDSDTLAIGFDNPVLPSTAFRAPWVDSDSALTFTLTADDGAGTASDSMNVNIIDTSGPLRDRDDIGRISLGNTGPGTVQVSWEAPEKTPVNYRISWAKVGEYYLTWNNSAGNAYLTVPSHTITGLEEDSRYKVKVQANYDGSSGGWSGEETITVARTPVPPNIPATGLPVITGTAEVGQTLAADASGIADADGMTNATLSYQWISGDGTTDTEIANATTSSHVLTTGDLDSTIKVTVTFTDDAGHQESLTSAATQTVASIPTVPNTPATGLPVITGTAEVGQTLAADASGVADADGMTNATLSYQWISGDGTTDTDIANATASSHVLTAGDLDSTIKVTVTFTDDAGHQESLTSAATQTVAPVPAVPNTPATGLPVITGTAEVGQTLTTDISGIADADGMTNATLRYQWISGDGTTDTEIANATTSSHVLTAGDLDDTIKVTVTFTDDAGHQESLTSAATQTVVPVPAVPGSPASLGVLSNGSGTLDVSWHPPASDGGSNLTGYTVQWKAASDAWTVPSDVTEAAVTGTAHTITGLTDGTPYTVRVAATNDVGDGAPSAEETATPQAPTPPLGPREIGGIVLNSTIPGVIDVSWDAPGETPANYRVMWTKVGESYLTWKDLTGNAFPTVPSHTITGLEDGRQYQIKVRASYDGTAGDWSDEVTATTAAGTVIVPNTPATGLPVITGTAEMGQTLVADASGIADADGMTNATLSYQWISGDGTTDTEIANATASSHVLTAGDLDSTIKVTVTFTDDAGHEESLTSAATQTVVPAPTVPGSPASLGVLSNGSGTLDVSWHPPASDGGSNLTGYTVQWKAASDAWTVPSDVTEAAVTGTAHTITGLTDGTPYTVRVAATNDVGDGAPSAEETATPQAPTPPLGPREIGGIVLNSTIPGVIDISWDAPGETPANYRVMWTKVGESYLTWKDLTGNAFPTVPSHTITGLEDGRQYQIKVRASYDGTAGDWSDEVTATTAAGTVIVPNTPATGLPVITGTAEMGQTLVADASGIADADGMTNATLSYQWISGDGTTDTEIANATASSHVLTAGDLDSTIKVTVTFTDDAGHEESLTSAATQTVVPAPTVPGSPASLGVLSNGSGTLDVSWHPPASDGGSNLTGYTVQWKAASDAWTVPSDVTEAAVTGTAHTITGLTDGTPYTVRVAATNDVGDGAPSAEETATPQAPTPPLGPREIGGIVLNSTIPGVIDISWDAPGETPANYRVMWTKVGESYLTWKDLTGNAFPTVPSHTITGLEEDEAYKVKVRARYGGTAGDWSDEVTATTAAGTVIVPNTPATGLPVITGTAEVGQTLAADASGIADADGMTNATLSYQWISGDGTIDIEIANATASSHILTAGDLDDTIKVTVTFTDDAGHEESLTSAATQTVAPVPAVPNTLATGLPVITGTAEVGQTLTTDISGIADADGMTNATLSYQWISYNGTTDTEIANATASSHILTAGDLNSTIKVTVTFTDDAGHEESLTSAATQTVAPVPAVPNTPATGLPVITGTAEVGQTLTTDISGIADADGMTNATLSYRWISGDGTTDTEIANATASSHILTAGDLDDTIKVTVTFTDDAGHEESLTSAATLAVTPAPSTTVVETPRQFITTWQTTLAGESITIPVGGATGIYTIDWGDGNADHDVSGDRRHAYDDAGTYTVRISGDFARIYLNGDQPNAGKLQSIEQWGDVRWESMESAFQGASSMVYRATDAPDLSDVASMGYMFKDAASFDGDLSAWDVSSVTDMAGLFHNADSFNTDLSDWDVSSVAIMYGMFMGTDSFNTDLSDWDVSSVTDMTRMFDHAFRFDGDLSDWDVSGVTTMDYMFHNAFEFNGNISTWDVSDVTDMRAMFRNAFYFNSDLFMWDVSGVTDMRAMFRDAAEFNDNISTWNVSGATKMRNMFSGADAFDQNLGGWYIVLDDTVIEGGNTTEAIGRIAAQNPFLDGQNPTYRIGSGADSEHFEIDGTALKLKKTAQNNLASGSYTITITSTGEFGTGNSRTYEIIIADT